MKSDPQVPATVDAAPPAALNKPPRCRRFAEKVGGSQSRRC